MKRLYVGAGIATKSTWVGDHNTIENRIESFALVSESRDDASGSALRYLHERWPIRLGYANHEVFLNEIATSDVAAWLTAIRDDGSGEYREAL